MCKYLIRFPYALFSFYNNDNRQDVVGNIISYKEQQKNKQLTKFIEEESDEKENSKENRKERNKD